MPESALSWSEAVRFLIILNVFLFICFYLLRMLGVEMGLMGGRESKEGGSANKVNVVCKQKNRARDRKKP